MTIIVLCQVALAGLMQSWNLNVQAVCIHYIVPRVQRTMYIWAWCWGIGCGRVFAYGVDVLDFVPLLNMLGDVGSTTRVGDTAILTAWQRTAARDKDASAVLAAATARGATEGLLRDEQCFVDMLEESGRKSLAARQSLTSSDSHVALGTTQLATPPRNALCTPRKGPSDPDARLPTVWDAALGFIVGSDAMCSRGAGGVLHFAPRVHKGVIIQYLMEVAGVPCRVSRGDGNGHTND